MRHSTASEWWVPPRLGSRGCQHGLARCLHTPHRLFSPYPTLGSAMGRFRVYGAPRVQWSAWPWGCRALGRHMRAKARRVLKHFSALGIASPVQFSDAKCLFGLCKHKPVSMRNFAATSWSGMPLMHLSPKRLRSCPCLPSWRICITCDRRARCVIDGDVIC